jgi:hypothetical protein
MTKVALEFERKINTVNAAEAKQAANLHVLRGEAISEPDPTFYSH